jgi:hypothetical protein
VLAEAAAAGLPAREICRFFEDQLAGEPAASQPTRASSPTAPQAAEPVAPAEAVTSGEPPAVSPA